MKSSFLLVLILLIALLSSCLTTRGDWEFDGLPQNYSIVRMNSRNIVLGQSNEVGWTHIVPTYISEVAYNDNYIFVKRVDVPKDINEKIDTSNPEYYIVVVETDEVLGAFTEEEFNKKCEEIPITEFPEWIITTTLKRYSNSD